MCYCEIKPHDMMLQLEVKQGEYFADHMLFWLCLYGYLIFMYSFHKVCLSVLAWFWVTYNDVESAVVKSFMMLIDCSVYKTDLYSVFCCSKRMGCL